MMEEKAEKVSETMRDDGEITGFHGPAHYRAPNT